MFSRFLSFVCIFSFLFNPLVNTKAQSSSQGLIVSPPIQEIEVVPGKTYSIDYDIENNTDTDLLTVDTSIETFEEGSIPGSANVVPFKSEKDFSYWLKVPKTQDFKKNINTKVTYQITIPDEVSPGAKFFAVTYQPRGSEVQNVDGKNTVVLKSRIATLIFVNIGGDSTKQPLIQNFSATPAWIDPLFDKIDVNYDVEVKGTSFYRPVGNLFLIDDNSDNITTLSSIISDNLILPGAKRSYSKCFGNNIFLTKCNEQSTFALPWLGKRDIEIRLDFTDGGSNPQSVTTKKQIIFAPYKTTLLLLGVLIIILLGFKTIKKYRK
ncbi:MAG: hypothetical protein H7196_03630 [candidate division SR1 bacterium]|nr:hypothetical protein [candidate division SR1 bacterium]